MIAFGFADNFLMILFGNTIDMHLGMYVSTMAAAGLGNMCSNICGLGLADYIENASAKLGVPQPKLSPKQRELTSARIAGFLGVVFGVSTGCVLGMFPLLFWDGKGDEDLFDVIKAKVSNVDPNVATESKVHLIGTKAAIGA